MVVSGCLVIRKTGKVHGADWHGKIVTFLLYGTAAVHIIWFHITTDGIRLLIGLCAIMMVISVALLLSRIPGLLRERLYKQLYIAMTRKIFRRR